MRKILRNFFFQRHNFAPNGPDFGEKAGQKWPVTPKNRGICATWRVARFILSKFNPVLTFSPPGHVRQPFLFPRD